jgi:hypothetical protein
VPESPPSTRDDQVMTNTHNEYRSTASNLRVDNAPP